jgi:hypothetical protein
MTLSGGQLEENCGCHVHNAGVAYGVYCWRHEALFQKKFYMMGTRSLVIFFLSSDKSDSSLI